MSAKELVGELDFLFKKFDEIISIYPIEKIKTIGDAYMCAGGLPVSNISNAMDVTLAALDIQKFMAEHNLQQKENNKPIFQIRIGIHTGPIVAGIVGIKKFAYDIWGDTVNTASRMESSGEAGIVNISETTYKYLSEMNNQSLRFTFRGKIQAKNKEDIEMYFVEKTHT
jgi:class 3 adenylate cyclase